MSQVALPSHLNKAVIPYSEILANPTDAVLELQQRSIEVLPSSQEKAFSSIKYFAIALVVAAAAGVVFSIYLPAALLLSAVALWYLWSSAIIVLNRFADGSCLETPIHALYALAIEANSVVAAAELFPFTLSQWYLGPAGNPNGRPILMVNGYCSFGSTWHYQRQKLVEAGFGPIYMMNVGTGSSIETYAGQIKDKVAEIKNETGRNDLILIGHSKGGLVSSYYATHLEEGTDTNITDVVTIASPLAGTYLANIGLGQDATEMIPDSKFIKDLRQEMQQSSKTRFYHIASEVDEVVPYPSALFGEDTSRQAVLKDVGHLGIVFSSRVADKISAWLAPQKDSQV